MRTSSTSTAAHNRSWNKTLLPIVLITALIGFMSITVRPAQAETTALDFTVTVVDNKVEWGAGINISDRQIPEELLAAQVPLHYEAKPTGTAAGYGITSETPESQMITVGSSTSLTVMAAPGETIWFDFIDPETVVETPTATFELYDGYTIPEAFQVESNPGSVEVTLKWRAVKPEIEVEAEPQSSDAPTAYTPEDSDTLETTGTETVETEAVNESGSTPFWSAVITVAVGLVFALMAGGRFAAMKMGVSEE